jgi:acetyl-CoA carboxylase biotin carboxyl carrier protein
VEIKHIKELMAVMQRTGTKRLVIKKEGVELELERQDLNYKMMEPALDLLDENPMRNEMAQHRANMMLAKGSDIQSMVTPSGMTQKNETVDVNSLYITSPMVGTFYSTPSPEDPPYVKVGQTIDKDSLVGIIEAMKVMNEIRAGVSGVVAEILVENGHPVEFGTKLYRIK